MPAQVVNHRHLEDRDSTQPHTHALNLHTHALNLHTFLQTKRAGPTSPKRVRHTTNTNKHTHRNTKTQTQTHHNTHREDTGVNTYVPTCSCVNHRHIYTSRALTKTQMGLSTRPGQIKAPHHT